MPAQVTGLGDTKTACRHGRASVGRCGVSVTETEKLLYLILEK